MAYQASGAYLSGISLVANETNDLQSFLDRELTSLSNVVPFNLLTGVNFFVVGQGNIPYLLYANQVNG